MGNFNVNILKIITKGKKKKLKLTYFMDSFQLKSQFSESTTKVGYQLDHIWANVLGNECKFSVTETYWSNFHFNLLTFIKTLTKLSCVKKNHKYL